MMAPQDMTAGRRADWAVIVDAPHLCAGPGAGKGERYTVGLASDGALDALPAGCRLVGRMTGLAVAVELCDRLNKTK